MDESQRRLKKVLDINFTIAFVVAFISAISICNWNWEFMIPFGISVFGMYYIRLWVKRWRLEESNEQGTETSSDQT